MYKIFEQFSKPDYGCSYENRVERERRIRWSRFKLRMEKVYDVRIKYDMRINQRHGDRTVAKAMKDQIECINNINKSCCIYVCCIGHERLYSNPDLTPIENSSNFEIIYKTLKIHGIEEGLIRTFELMPECVKLYRDVVKYYELRQLTEPVPKDHDKINSIYKIFWSKQSTEPTVEWVHRGVRQVHRSMPGHTFLIPIAIIRLRMKLGKESYLLSILHKR